MGWEDWIRTVEIEPAIGARDAVALERQVETLLRAGARIIHVNAPPGTAPEAVAALTQLTQKYDAIIDLHAEGDNLVEFAIAGADSVTFDASAVEDVPAAIDALRSAARGSVGVAFGADFDPEEVATAAAGADLILCAYESEDATERLRRLAIKLRPGVALQVEGDVSYESVLALYNAGARLLVAGEVIFVREDLPRAYRRLVQALA